MALDKCPGIRPIRIGEIWHRLLAKRVLKVAGAEAKDVCGNAQLWTGLESGIEGASHITCTLFAERDNKEEWGFLLVDAANAFTTGNRITCLWAMRYRCSSGARFSMNYYRHQVLLLVRADDRHGDHWLVSREGVTQGDPLTMILYEIGMLPLTLQLKAGSIYLFTNMVCR